MKRIFHLLLICLAIPMHATLWEELFEIHKQIISPTTYQMIRAQYTAVLENNAPVIAEPRITSIAIIECDEELVDIAQKAHPRISVMSDQDLLLAHECEKDIDQRSPRHSFVRKSIYESLEHMIAELDRLAPYFGYESGELCIKLFEGLRDLETQKIVFDKCLHNIMQQNPSLSYDEATEKRANGFLLISTMCQLILPVRL